MNSYRYKPSTVIFDERVKATLLKIQNEYNYGKSKTKTQYAYEIKEAVINFYKNMGKPNYKFIPASDVPSYIHYKKMMEVAATDMKEIVTGCEYLIDILSDMNTAMVEETNIVNRNIFIMDNKIQEIEKRINTISDASSMVFTDSFEHNNNASYDNGEEKLSSADVNDGVCRLATEKMVTESDFELSILDTSNGFPGNTHEVFETMNGIKYIGEVDPRLSIYSATTKDANDWFEFEMYNIDSETRMKTSSVGFRYQEGISWLSDEDELVLDLKATFPTPRMLNTININGIPKVNYHTDHPMIKEIIIKDDYAGVQVIKYGDYLLEKTVISFKPQMVKEVIIKISQKDSVITNVARTYALSIDPNRIPYFFNDDLKGFTQVDKPTISIEALGLSYDPKTKGIKYPSSSSKNSFLNKEYVKSNLFYSNTNATDNDKLFSEIISAYRYRIGISFIGFSYKEYIETGAYLSKTFQSKEPIKKITLNAIDKIPHSYRRVIEDKSIKKPYIGYYLSFNDEEDWYQIYPRTIHKSGPCSIVINSHLNVESRNSNVIYLDRLIDAYSIRLKIEMRRPISIVNETPVVNEYNLDIDGEE